jgi:hypothetical protein
MIPRGGVMTMFFIFGWGGGEPKYHGPTFAIPCGNCDKKEPWSLVSITQYFTLFFIPIFPYETNYLLTCPICNHGTHITAQVFNKLKPVAENNLNFLNKSISQIDFEKNIDIHYKDAVNELKVFMKSLSAQSEKGVLCPFCNQIPHTNEGKLFVDRKCVKCGKELPSHMLSKIKAMHPR